MPHNEGLFDCWYADGSKVLQETEHSVAFLPDICCTAGHVLVVPKQQADNIADLGLDGFAMLMQDVYAIMHLLKDKLQVEGAHILQNDNGWKIYPDYKHHVRQVHVHVIANDGTVDIEKRAKRSSEDIKKIKRLLLS